MIYKKKLIKIYYFNCRQIKKRGINILSSYQGFPVLHFLTSYSTPQVALCNYHRKCNKKNHVTVGKLRYERYKSLFANPKCRSCQLARFYYFMGSLYYI